MRKEMNKLSKGILCAALTMAVSLTGIQMPQGSYWPNAVMAEAATTSDKLPIVCYTIGNSRVTTYTTSSLTKSTGWIAAGDKCTIKAIYSNGSVKVTYPVARGTRTAFASATAFFGNIDWSTSTTQIGSDKTAYAKSSGSSTIGTV